MAAKKTAPRKKTAPPKKVAKTAKVSARAPAKKAEGILGRLAQRSAQLILDSGILGKVPPKRAPAKRKKGPA